MFNLRIKTITRVKVRETLINPSCQREPKNPVLASCSLKLFTNDCFEKLEEKSLNPLHTPHTHTRPAHPDTQVF